MLYAITREVSPAIGDCELTHLARQPIDIARARRQHAAYRELLGRLGCAVLHLPAADGLADSVFVEDIAVVVPELAVLTHPGAASRHPETPAVADALRRFREVAAIPAPARLDGGDVLRVGRRLWVGQGGRSDAAGLARLHAHLAPFGYTVDGARHRDCLHLKSAVTALDDHTVLLNPEWIDATLFSDLRVIESDPTEPFAGNVLSVAGAVIVAAEHPLTRARLQAHDFETHTVAASELAKAEGALTCCSLVFDA